MCLFACFSPVHEQSYLVTSFDLKTRISCGQPRHMSVMGLQRNPHQCGQPSHVSHEVASQVACKPSSCQCRSGWGTLEPSTLNFTLPVPGTRGCCVNGASVTCGASLHQLCLSELGASALRDLLSVTKLARLSQSEASAKFRDSHGFLDGGLQGRVPRRGEGPGHRRRNH
jgi:hypothetical protein